MNDSRSVNLDADFEEHRVRLRGLAYRMLASAADAEDIVQDAWLRWHEARHRTVENAGAYLTRIVNHLCLDRLKSAQARRECYVGQWLPEPLLASLDQYQPGPEVAHELAHDLSFALLRALDTLSPLERAAFMLHDIFDVDFETIAGTLARDAAACRQLASRARQHIRAARPRFETKEEDGTRPAKAFVTAIAGGDLEALTQVLANDAVFYSDGGGKVAGVLHPLHGSARVARAMLGFAKSYSPADLRIAFTPVNGMAGVLISNAAGQVVQTIAFEINDRSHITAIYVQRNPEQLRHIVAGG